MADVSAMLVRHVADARRDLRRMGGVLTVISGSLRIAQ